MPTGGGAGGGGLASVSVTARLTGDGTSGSPLDIAGWPEAAYVSCGTTYASIGITANQVEIAGFALSHALTFAHIAVNINTADGTNNSDIGLYTKAGALVANIGATKLSATGIHAFATLQGSQTITPGLYLFALTSAGSTLYLNIENTMPAWAFNANVASSSGGVLPATIGAVAAAPADNMPWFALY